MVYDITNSDSLDQLTYFNDLIDMEAETRMDAAASAVAGTRQAKNGTASKGMAVMPVKIVAGNKCDLQNSRQVDARTGLEWARKRNCGFMETSARNVVNIEETFALLVRRVVERRRAAAELQAAAAGMDRSGKGGKVMKLPPQGLAFDVGSMTGGGSGVGTRRAVTAPLSPLPDEKGTEFRRGVKGPPRDTGFWGKLRCW